METEFGIMDATSTHKEQKKLAKYALITVAVGLSAYGVARTGRVGRQLVRVNETLNSINATTASIGQFLVSEAMYREAAQTAMQEAITVNKLKGTKFTYYPGVGIFLDSVMEAQKTVKEK